MNCLVYLTSFIAFLMATLEARWTGDWRWLKLVEQLGVKFQLTVKLVRLR